MLKTAIVVVMVMVMVVVVVAPMKIFTEVLDVHFLFPPGHFKEIFDMHPTNLKRMYVVDGGLTFNSPYPLLLRPQRHVDLLLSFDFSARPSDSTPPFKVGPPPPSPSRVIIRV